jgi:hypothetical protein
VWINIYLAPVYGDRDPELNQRFNVSADTGRIQSAKLMRIRIMARLFRQTKIFLKHFLISSQQIQMKVRKYILAQKHF